MHAHSVPYAIRFLLCALPLATDLTAADFTWTGGSVVDSAWSSRFNWSPSTAPPLSDNTTNLTFAGGTRTSPNAQDPYTLRSILFSGTTASFTLTGSTLTLSGSGPFVRNESGNPHTVQNTLSFSNGGTLRAQNANLTITGQTLIPAGTLTLQADLGREITTTTLGGAGNVSKAGGGTLNLNGLTALTGSLSLSAGTVNLGNNLSATGGFTSGATASLILNSHNASFGLLEGSGPINLGSGLLTVNQSADSTTTSAITGTTGAFTKTGAGTLSVGGAMSHGGTTTVNGGILRATAASRFSIASAHQIGASGTLDLNSLNQSIGSLAGSGTVALGSGSLFLGHNNADTVWSGTIGGTGEVVKNGSGTFTITTNQTQSGGTLINFGTLFLRNSGGLGTPLSPTTVITGATLRLDRDLNIAATKPVVIAGVGDMIKGAIRFESFDGTGDLTFAPSFTLAGNTTITHANPEGTFSIGDGGAPGTITLGTHNLTFHGDGDGPIRLNHSMSGSGSIIHNRADILVLNGVNTVSFSGGLDMQAGRVQIANPNAIGSGSGGGINVAAGAALELQGPLQFSTARELVLSGILVGDDGATWLGNGPITVASTTARMTAEGSTFTIGGTGTISGSGNARLELNSPLNRTITLNRNITSLGAGGLTKLGSGLAILGGSASYTGNTEIDVGTLRLASSDRLPDGSLLSINSGATFDLNSHTDTVAGLLGQGNVLLGSGTLKLATPATASTFSGTISGTGGIEVLAGLSTQSFFSPNTYTGPTVVRSGGRLNAAAAGAIGTGNALTVETGGLLQIANATQIISALSGGGQIQFTGGASGIRLEVTSPTTWDGAFTGAGEVTKPSVQPVTFTASSPHTGSTRVQAGILQAYQGLPNSHVFVEADNAAFYGNGTFAQITTTGNLHPGRLNAPIIGTMQVNGPVTLLPDGKIRMDIQDWGGGPGFGHDVIDCESLHFNGIIGGHNTVFINLPASLIDFSETPRVFKIARTSSGTIANLNLGTTVHFSVTNQSTASPQGTWTLRALNGDLEAVYTPPGSNTYQTWIDGFNVGGQDGPEDDFDADGIPNAIEYVLGGNPQNVDDSNKLPTSTVDNGDLVFVFRRTSRSVYLDPAVYHSTTLQPPWTQAVNGSGGVTITTNPIDGETDEVTVRIPMDGATRRFARLEVFVP